MATKKPAAKAPAAKKFPAGNPKGVLNSKGKPLSGTEMKKQQAVDDATTAKFTKYMADKKATK